MSIVKLNNRGVKDVTAFGSISSLGELTFISKQTASSSATISFTSGIDSTYKEYIFYFNNIHPSDEADFTFQANAVGGSGYNETITSTTFDAFNRENDTQAVLNYYASTDQAQGTSFQSISLYDTGNEDDESGVGELIIFNPSNTTFVTQFISNFAGTSRYNYPNTGYVAGYFNTTSAIDAIQFKMDSGNIDSGTIKLYGIS